MGLIIAIIGLAIFVPLAIAAASFAPWVPSRSRDLERVARLANLQPGQYFYELGSGNGKVSLFIARHTKAHVVGIERTWSLAFLSWLRVRIAGYTNVVFRWGNLFKADIRDADVVYVFGMPDPLKDKLRFKLEKELRPGTKVLSYTFAIGGLDPVIVDRMPGRATIYVYQF
jgi:SAM-dependent methyltransferase